MNNTTDVTRAPAHAGAPSSRIVELSEEVMARLFTERQNLGKALKKPDATYLVIPSISVDKEEIQFIQRALVDYEHRLLWLINRAENGRRVIFVSALPTSRIATSHMLACAAACSHGNVAMETICLEDTSALPLADKLLARPDWLKRLKHTIQADDKNAVLVPFMGTEREFQLGKLLGIPVVATPHELNYLGTKSGSRKVCRKAGLLVPDGFEDMENELQLVEAADELWFKNPHLNKLVVKVNEGISGYGNGVLTLPKGDPKELSPNTRRTLLQAALPRLNFQTSLQEYGIFMTRMAKIGGVIEIFLEGSQKTSPSGQGFLHPGADVELLSTHEQILTGPDGMVYDGAIFPAHQKSAIGVDTLNVGEVLREEGAIGYFGVDFLKVNGKRFALEINLRQGGTTHLRAQAMLSTGATFDPKTGNFVDQFGRNIYYAGTDGLRDKRLQTLPIFALLEHFDDCGLKFRRSKGTGVMFHLLDSINRTGSVGFTAVSQSRAGARKLYNQTRVELSKLLGKHSHNTK